MAASVSGRAALELADRVRGRMDPGAADGPAEVEAEMNKRRQEYRRSRCLRFLPAAAVRDSRLLLQRNLLWLPRPDRLARRAAAEYLKGVRFATVAVQRRSREPKS